MLNLLLRAEKTVLIGCALGVAALTGWSSFAYSSLSGRSEARILRAERDAALERHEKLEQATGDLDQVQAKLASARDGYTRAVHGWAETRTRLGAAQQELAVLTKRIDAVRERVAHTGSVRAAAEATKSAPAKKTAAASAKPATSKP